MGPKTWLRAAGSLLLLAPLAACGGDGDALAAGERRIQIAAVEPKGSTSVDKEPFPTEALPAGGGYALEEPDAEGVWVVETYQWSPGTIAAIEGDHVVLEILGVNGSSHTATIEGYDIDFEVTRGQLTTVEFDADRPGIFTIVCTTHQPAMNGTLVVLPAD